MAEDSVGVMWLNSESIVDIESEFLPLHASEAFVCQEGDRGVVAGDDVG